MTTLTTIFLVILFFMLITVVWFLIWETGRINAKHYNDYEKRYARIKYVIDNYKVCEANYKWIMKLLTGLGKMKHKNKEKTSVLTITFFRKYQDIVKQKVNK